MASSLIKFNDYTEQLNRGVHNWAAHTFKVRLTNSAPNPAWAVAADIVGEIAAGNGYPSGGLTLDTVVLTESNGITTLACADETLTAQSGPIPTFRWLIILNDTAANKPLYGAYDYGVGGVTLAVGEAFTIDTDPVNGIWQMQ